jgi:hypothetical protein
VGQPLPGPTSKGEAVLTKESYVASVLGRNLGEWFVLEGRTDLPPVTEWWWGDKRATARNAAQTGREVWPCQLSHT